MSEHQIKYAVIHGSPVYHDVEWTAYCGSYGLVCSGFLAWPHELRKHTPRGKRLCKRCAKARRPK